MPGYANPAYGRGFWGWGRGRGGGRGWRNWYYATGLPGWQRSASPYPAWGRALPHTVPVAAPISKQQEFDALKGQAEYLEQALADIHKRLEEIKAQGTGE